MKNKDLTHKAFSEVGQALIILIVALAVAISILAAAIVQAADQGKIAATDRLGKKVYYAAETGAEYALIKLLRNPNACSGSDTLNSGGVNINIIYNPSGAGCTITSQAQEKDIQKKIRLEASINQDNTLNFCCWKQIP